MADFTLQDWLRCHEKIADMVKGAPKGYQAETAIEGAEELLACSRALAGVACPKCGGMGERMYGSTSTWHGGIGGMSMTNGTCDVCWGTGRTDKKGPNLRDITRRLQEANDGGK